MGKRVIWIVLDSAGVGEAPDSNKYDDAGADTLGHIIEACTDIKLPNMTRLGLYNIGGTSFKGKKSCDEIIGCYGKAREMSNGKDTTTGHWEMIGINTINPFPTYPDGFPKELIERFIEETGCGGVYGNVVASGVPIIQEYGDLHMQTGYPIIYTSADSVFQIAASEERLGLDKLYDLCRTARRILVGEHGVGRVIARPFVRKEDGTFERTANRRDYALEPDSDNVLNHLKDNGIKVYAVGKISDIFNGVGIWEEVHTVSNSDGMDKTLEYMKTVDGGLIFTNLVDFDMKFGHRRDVSGYRDALEEFDKWLGGAMDILGDEDLIIINADHGCDPTYKGTDHTREFVPVLVYGRSINKGVNLGVMDTFADIGKIVEEYLCGNPEKNTKTVGKSFLDKLI